MSPSPLQASEQWQTALLILFGALVLFATVRGWFRGLLLQLLIPMAIAGAALVVYLFTGNFVGLLGMQASTLSAGGLLVARLLLGLFLYYLIQLVGGFIFRSTNDYDLAVSRWVSGVGGALLGFGYGLLVVWLCLIAFRVIGRVAEDQASLQIGRGLTPSPALTTIAKAKASLELGWVGTVVHDVDPIPAQFYESIDRWNSILERPDALKRLVVDPAFRGFSDNAKFQALANDPEIANLIEKGDLLGVVTNPKVLQFLTDPEVNRILFGSQADTAQYTRKQ